MLIEINFWSAGWTRDCPWRAWVLSEESSIGMETLQIMGKVYGVYSFLTGRVVDEKTGAPVKNARVLIIGPALPEIRKIMPEDGGIERRTLSATESTYCWWPNGAIT